MKARANRTTVFAQGLVRGMAVLVLACAGVLLTGGMSAYADTVEGLAFDAITVENAQTHEQVADLKAGEVPALKSGITYALDVSYDVPSALQYTPTYLNVYLGNGLYITGLPGATYVEGPIDNTSFEKLVTTPTGTGTSPYGYPTAGTDQARSGALKLQTKNGLIRVDTKAEILFRVDDAYETESAAQTLADAIQVSLSTDTASNVDAYAFTVNPADTPTYGFYVNRATETISKGGSTSRIESYNTGSKASLTQANSKTVVQIVYPKGVELVSLNETSLYKKPGTVVSTVEEGDNLVSTVEWDEPGSYSGGLNFKPELKVPADSAIENGSSFNVTLRNFKKTIWNDSTNTGRTSATSTATMKVTVIDGQDPELITTYPLVDSPANWSLKKYDTYNTRLGAYLIKNELNIPTKPKTLEMTIDQAQTAIVRGVTIPYAEGMTLGKIHWTASDGTSGDADPSVLKTAGVSALLTNTALGLDSNTSITSIKVDLGALPADYDGVQPSSDLLAHDARGYYLYDEFYGWDHIPCSVFGAWKEGTQADVVSTVKLYTTGTESGEGATITGRSSAPEVLNGVGTISKSQINGGDSFTISGRIDDANWDWNPLQEPVIYVIMPEGFSYSDLSVTEGTLSAPEYVGAFDDDGTQVKVWKYSIDVGQETRGQYQPDFSIKSMNITMNVQTNKLAAKGTYHINDFLGITTKDFKDIGAVIKAEHWDHSNWNTGDYTSLFGDAVNSGETMASLSEATGVNVNQASEIAGASSFFVTDGQTGTTTEYTYDPENAQATTPVLQKGDTATVHIGVRNNAFAEANATTVFVPLLSSSVEWGKSFTPEGATKLPLTLKSAVPSANFTVKYIKLNDGATYEKNHAPVEGEYTEVSDPAQADMLMLVSDAPLAINKAGYVDVTYQVADEVGASYNGTRDVFSSCLKYDIEGNRSMFTLGTNAVTFAGSDVVLTKTWNDGNNAGGYRPSADDFAKALTLTCDKDIDLSGYTPQVTDNGDGTYTAAYRGLPAHQGKVDNAIAYTVTEGAFAHYTADKTSITGSGDTVQGAITNTYAPTPVKHDPPVTKKIEGPAPATPDTFTLTRDSDAFPMPAQSKDGSKTITITGAGTSEFGEITFAYPGVYTYTITEAKGTAACTYDQALYHLTYTVTDDGSGTLQVTRTMTKVVDGKESAVDLGQDGSAVGAEFTNVYPAQAEQNQEDGSGSTTTSGPVTLTKTKAGTAPATGDSMMPPGLCRSGAFGCGRSGADRPPARTQAGLALWDNIGAPVEHTTQYQAGSSFRAVPRLRVAGKPTCGCAHAAG